MPLAIESSRAAVAEGVVNGLADGGALWTTTLGVALSVGLGLPVGGAEAVSRGDGDGGSVLAGVGLGDASGAVSGNWTMTTWSPASAVFDIATACLRDGDPITVRGVLRRASAEAALSGIAEQLAEPSSGQTCSTW
jgi:hypothetical protein